MATTVDPRAARRERVRQLSATGASTRTIAKELRVSKDTVRRDMAHLKQQPDQQEAPDAPTPTALANARRATLARREDAGADAVRHLGAAVAQVAHIDLPCIIASREVGRQWAAELRAQAAALASIADTLARYYPDASA
ncbi:hypothetical protein SLA_2400 [Streptomyces laurentii]|uniref:Uncharacterized protein n=1 Tax=Streptomyces laurentii TaxID=39478 RepID=A0A160NX12_STRLU|nr:hypothetical protein SLA_2400 [Streptomyces laurentii]